MSPGAILWITFGFAALLIIFFIAAYFAPGEISQQRYNMLHFLGALAGAFSGAFVTGFVIFQAGGNLPTGGTYSISAGAGFALFLLIWFFFPKYPGPDKSKDGAIAFAVPKGKHTFQSLADALAQLDRGSTIDYVGFRAEEKTAKLKEWTLQEDSVSNALRQLRLITVASGAVRPYVVALADKTYTLTVKE
jgi:hypothetical protein